MAALILVPSPAVAETIESDLVLIREGDVVAEDLYAVGNRVDIDGVVRGDVVAAAFEEVRIDGTIDGSLTALAGRVVVTGDVGGSVRGLAGAVVVEGDVAGDVAVVAGDLRTTGGSNVGRDMVAAAWRSEVHGALGRSMEGAFRTLLIDGTIGGTVEVSVRRLTLGGGAVVGGDLAYRSSTPATIDDAATVDGSVLTRRALPPNVRVVALGIMFRALLTVFSAGVGLATVWVSPSRSDGAAEALRSRGVAAAISGLVVVALPAVMVAGVAVLLSLTPPESAIPLVLATVPVFLGVLGVLALAALVAPVPPAILIGSRLLGSRTAYARFVVGFAVIAGLALIPLVGRWVLATVVALGLGAWLLPQRG